jgi:hypothetical protein
MNDEIDFFEQILNSKLILIAYDCDFNYEPCNKKGIKAHWALITGFLLPLDLTDKNSDLIYKKTEAETQFNVLDYTKPLQFEQIQYLRKNYENKILSNNKNFKDLVFVICKHGKSKNLGIWNLSKLIESNKQLKQINDSKCNRDEFVLPVDGDLSRTLSSKYLVFN